MTSPDCQAKLHLLDREILDRQVALSRQAALIEWLAGAGQSTTTAEALLEAMRADLATLIAQRMAIAMNGGVKDSG